MAGKKLHFVALIPPEELKIQVRKLKEEIREKYAAKHALKLPAHITLQPPFSLSLEQETELFSALEDTAQEQNIFQVNLSGFGSFPPRVIFIKVEDHEPIKKLHSRLQTRLEKVLPIKENLIHPHMTLASRDLKKKDFPPAWAEFEKCHFRDSFLARSLFLLRHNNKSWDILREFDFSAK